MAEPLPKARLRTRALWPVFLAHHRHLGWFWKPLWAAGRLLDDLSAPMTATGS
jgi:hypothetical protein